MYQLFEQRLNRLVGSNVSKLLQNGLIGLEKETLRVGEDGKIAQTPHPASLGSSLSHPYITTDYAESLTEIITPPFSSAGEALNFLKDTQTFVHQQLGSEILWATSMPCVVAGETSIPIAQYGTSNQGMMKTVYRRGLGYRYGRTMQVIAGVHFNYSVPEPFWPAYQELEGDKQPLQDFISEKYFELIRNLQRFGWLIPYLFGASPAVCKSFLAGQKTDLDVFNENTFYEPYATSLRMGDIGYQNNKENAIGVKAKYDSLTSYVDSLTQAINTVYPGYEKFGVCVDGEYRQLNANILQIENEYYSTVRPKQILNGNEKPTVALKKRGVRYVELRSLDVNAFDPLGINETQVHFLEVFMLFCLLHSSPVFSSEERKEIDLNELFVAHKGREQGAILMASGKEKQLTEWARELFGQMQAVAEILDYGHTDQPYQKALTKLKARLDDPEMTPSARMLQAMRDNREGFFDFALRKSLEHQQFFLERKLSDDKSQLYKRWVEESHKKTEEIELGQTESFSEYLASYFAQN